MEATLKAKQLRSLTKALTCLSKYGDELQIQATADGVSLSCTNSAKSAFGRFSFPSEFFVKYNIGPGVKPPGSTFAPTPDGPGQGLSHDVKGEVPVKVFLSILKARHVEKTVEKVDLEIYDGPEPGENSREGEKDELESKLVVKLHCKGGVTKTHRLFLNVPDVILGVRIPESQSESRLRIGPETVKDILDHFQPSGGKARDMQLTWEFGATKVKVKSLETERSADSFLATELTIVADEFDEYHIPEPPIALAWHLREFSATITHAESLGLTLELRFTEPSSPLFIEIDTSETEEEMYQTLFAISTVQINNDEEPDGSTREAEKRPREETAVPVDQRPSKKKSLKVAGKGDAFSNSQSSRRGTQMLPPTGHPAASQAGPPLFIPPSQLSQREQSVLQDSGLGDGNMGYDDFVAMMEDEGEEFLVPLTQQNGTPREQRRSGSPGEDVDEDMDPLGATQPRHPSHSFEPLFDD